MKSLHSETLTPKFLFRWSWLDAKQTRGSNTTTGQHLCVSHDESSYVAGTEFRIKASPFQVEVAGHSDSDAMPKKWQKFYKSNWELSAARGASVVRYMIENGVPAPRMLAAGYGDWYPKGIDSIKSINPMYNPLTLTWGDGEQPLDTKGNPMVTVLSLNRTKKQKSSNRRIQITFISPPHHKKLTEE